MQKITASMKKYLKLAKKSLSAGQIKRAHDSFPTSCCHVIYHERADSAGAGRNSVKLPKEIMD